AHRIHVGNRVGGGDTAEVIRVVDDRHEKIGGRDQRLFIVELVDGGVVGGFDADHQLFRHRETARIFQDFGQHAGCDLAAAAAAVGKGGELDLRFGDRVHGRVSFIV